MPLLKLLPIALAAVIVLLSSYNYGMGYGVTGAYGAGTNHVGDLFAVRNDGFHVSPYTNTGAAVCQWEAGTRCSGGLTTATWYYGFSLVLRRNMNATQDVTVTVGWDQGSGPTQMGSLHVTVPAGAKAGQSMYFGVGTGASAIADQLAVEVVVT